MTSSVPSSEQWLCDFLYVGIASDRQRELGVPVGVADYGHESGRHALYVSRMRKRSERTREVAHA